MINQSLASPKSAFCCVFLFLSGIFLAGGSWADSCEGSSRAPLPSCVDTTISGAAWEISHNCRKGNQLTTRMAFKVIVAHGKDFFVTDVESGDPPEKGVADGYTAIRSPKVEEIFCCLDLGQGCYF